MRVLIAHVRYLEAGGEDVVAGAEAALLRDAGHEVEYLDLRASELRRLSLRAQAGIAVSYADHAHGRRALSDALMRAKPNVVHFHNLYPLLGPGAVDETTRRGVAAVQTLHNYRLSCLNGRHFRDGRVCEDCSPGSFSAGIRHACYRSSRLQSRFAATASTRQWQSFIRHQAPSLALAVSEFVRRKYVGYGADPRRIIVKPCSVDETPDHGPLRRGGALFVGRLSFEKGILELARSWPAGDLPLTIVGQGPFDERIRLAAGPNVTLAGGLPHDETLRRLRGSRVLVVPSLWYEGLPLSALEALAAGTPVVAFRGGSLEELLERIDSNCTAPLGDFDALFRVARRVAFGEDWDAISERCRAEYLARFSREADARALVRAYRSAVALAGLAPEERRLTGPAPT